MPNYNRLKEAVKYAYHLDDDFSPRNIKVAQGYALLNITIDDVDLSFLEKTKMRLRIQLGKINDFFHYMKYFKEA